MYKCLKPASLVLKYTSRVTTISLPKLKGCDADAVDVIAVTAEYTCY